MRTKRQQKEQHLIWQDTMKHISKLATHSPITIIEDVLGLTAIFVILMVGLYLPGL
jgi:hypothetical protein